MIILRSYDDLIKQHNCCQTYVHTSIYFYLIWLNLFLFYYLFFLILSLSGGQMVRAPGRATYMPQSSGFETRHGLMPMKCLPLYSIEEDGS